MAKFYVCSVYDVKVEAFMQPFFMRSRGEAMRSFMDACSPGSRNELFVKHPQDYSLMLLGYYDDVSGQLSNLQPIEQIMSGLDAVRWEDKGNDKLRDAAVVRPGGDVNRDMDRA